MNEEISGYPVYAVRQNIEPLKYEYKEYQPIQIIVLCTLNSGAHDNVHALYALQ
jgi:hypothetical protein